ncbi:hypothetical protein Tco_1441292, partial [Tanacetum coccineum]
CPKNIDSSVAKNLKKPSQAPRGVSIGPKVVFKPSKQVYKVFLKKTNANTSENKKKDVESPKEVSNSNPLNVLNSVEYDFEFGKNRRTSNLTSKNANSSGSLFLNVDSSSPSTTHIDEKIDKIEKLLIDRKVIIVDDDGKPLEKVDSSGDHDSEDEVVTMDNEMASFLALKKVGYGTHSQLKQRKDTYENADYDYDQYDDDMYEG